MIPNRPDTVWLFDYDLTLYGTEERYVINSLDHRISLFVQKTVGTDFETAHKIRTDYLERFGTTLAGLMAMNQVDPDEFFDFIQENKTKIKRQQYPLMLAYAINNHKSQGMTFDKLVVNFHDVFGDGMGYVVLSRTRSLNGLYLKGFDCKKIQTSQKVIQFY